MSELARSSDAFGGGLLKGNPKTKRPLHSHFPVHVTLRAQKSVLRLPGLFGVVEKLILSTANKYGVKLYEHANVGNHIHLLLRVNRKLWPKFIRELTGRIAQISREKGLRIQGNFWRYRPHTRIVRGWRRAFQVVRDYIRLNRLEAMGRISRRDTRSLRELKALWSDGS